MVKHFNKSPCVQGKYIFHFIMIKMLKLVLFSLTYFSLFYVVVDGVDDVVINPGDIPTEYLVMVAYRIMCP